MKNTSESKIAIQSFQKRFQGRTKLIGKAGLLSLMEQVPLPSNPPYQSTRMSQIVPRRVGQEMTRNNLQRHPASLNPEFDILMFDSLEEISKKSSNYSSRTEQPARRSQKGLGSPNKNSHKFIHPSHKLQASVPRASSIELITQSKRNLIQNSGSKQQNSDHTSHSYNDDKFRHLHFLNLFESRIQRNRAQ